MRFTWMVFGLSILASSPYLASSANAENDSMTCKGPIVEVHGDYEVPGYLMHPVQKISARGIGVICGTSSEGKIQVRFISTDGEPSTHRIPNLFRELRGNGDPAQQVGRIALFERQALIPLKEKKEEKLLFTDNSAWDVRTDCTGENGSGWGDTTLCTLTPYLIPDLSTLSGRGSANPNVSPNTWKRVSIHPTSGGNDPRENTATAFQ